VTALGECRVGRDAGQQCEEGPRGAGAGYGGDGSRHPAMMGCTDAEGNAYKG
jgi:hypothetical protein